MGQVKSIKNLRRKLNLHFFVCINLFFINIIFAQFQNGKNVSNNPKYNVSSERYFTDNSGTILMNVNIWGHVNQPGRHMVFDGIDLATLLSVVGGPKSGANLKNVRLFRETPDQSGEHIYTINLDNFLKTGDRSEFVKIMPNDTFIIPQTTTSYIMAQIGTLNTVLSILNIYLQIENRN